MRAQSAAALALLLGCSSALVSGLDSGTRADQGVSPDGGLSDASPPVDAGTSKDAAATTDDATTIHVGPQLIVTPVDSLIFSLPTPRPPPPIPPRTQAFNLRNAGDEDLQITGLQLLGPGGDRASTSINDFTLAACPSWPCDPMIVLCGEASPGCADFERSLDVTYANDDASELDLAELTISSNDPGKASYWLVLQAEDSR